MAQQYTKKQIQDKIFYAPSPVVRYSPCGLGFFYWSQQELPIGRSVASIKNSLATLGAATTPWGETAHKYKK